MKVIQFCPDAATASGVNCFCRELDHALGEDSAIVRSFAELCGEEVEKRGILHIHGMWLREHHRAAVWARQNKIPVVWSTHGMTAPWAMRHKRWKKLLAWWLYQKRDLKGAALVHCTTELEEGWNRALGLRNQFVVARLGTQVGEVEKRGGERKEFVVLFVGRIHPVKGLMNLVKAVGLIKNDCGASGTVRPTVVFRIVGPDEGGHMAELKAECDRLGIGERWREEVDSGVSVSFAGERYGDDLTREYENCDVLVLPSWTENFGATVVEALAHGKPVIASKFTPWKVMETERCGWWVGNSPESLAAAIREACGAAGVRALPEMGERGRRLVREKYTWAAVAAAMRKGYNTVG
ncbi:MAG: glycosyltransferase [bacterium]|nr:glycosyltransferase [Candidatus Colisoma equi]